MFVSYRSITNADHHQRQLLPGESHLQLFVFYPISYPVHNTYSIAGKKETMFQRKRSFNKGKSKKVKLVSSMNEETIVSVLSEKIRVLVSAFD